jgi:iron complex outermembrane receptor protein
LGEFMQFREASWAGFAVGAALCLCASPAHADDPIRVASIQDLGDLSIEDLANVEITSVSRRPESIRGAPASIFVITREDIRRAGARSLPEALRLAPNLQVARIDSASYAITARGFNQPTGTANKLQVLIDGRSVYTPLYSGVFWDTQNVLLEDVDRIEVISGPGGALWGANAVNGIINVITRDTHETEGLYASAGYGEFSSELAVRHGGRIGESGAYRVYGLGLQRGPSQLASGADAGDEWQNLQGGVRFDWGSGRDAFTVQGDIYAGEAEDAPAQVRDTTSDGGNLRGRWTRRFADDSVLTTQITYDRQRRAVSSGILSAIDTMAIDSQYDFSPSDQHRIVIGGGLRINEDRFEAGPGTAYLDPEERTLRLGQIFVQDTYAATDSVDVTLGLKLEHNSYTGLEYMPNLRIAAQLSETSLVWGAVSRAVRTPSRFDRDLYSPVIAGGAGFESEDMVSYELGYRGQPTMSFSFSASTYYNVYENLRSLEGDPVTVFPFTIGNEMRGESYGLEAWGDYAAASWWRLSAGVNLFEKTLELESGSQDVFGVSLAGNDPGYQIMVRSLMNIAPDFELDLSLRSIDELPAPATDGYTEMDARFDWRATDHLTLQLSGYNLLNDEHTEYVGTSLAPRSLPRTFMLTARWRS